METVKSYNKQIFVFLKNNSFTRMSVSNFNTSAERNTSVRELFFFYIVRKYIQNCHLMAAWIFYASNNWIGFTDGM